LPERLEQVGYRASKDSAGKDLKSGAKPKPFFEGEDRESCPLGSPVSFSRPRSLS